MTTEIAVAIRQQEQYATSAMRKAYRAWFLAHYLRRIEAVGLAREVPE